MDLVRPDEAFLTPARDDAAYALDDAGIHRFRFRAMASVHELLLGGISAARAKRVASSAIAEVLRIEAKYSRFRDDSVISTINRAAGRRPVAIDHETAGLLRYADRCYALSEGRFDITSGVLRGAWDFRRVPPRIPADHEIARVLPLIGWPRVEWSERTMRLPTAGMQIDLGGIGKEYAADRAATICRDEGILHVLVNLGGDVRAIGGRDDASPWRIGIRHPRVAGATIATVALGDGAIATSGDYERFIEVDGKRHCHLLDPRTGWPVSHWQSVSAVAPLAILAGSYATLAMLLERDAEDFLERHGVAALLVAADGSLRRCGEAAIDASSVMTTA
jgi:FAD:protein FMN transferase